MSKCWERFIEDHGGKTGSVYDHQPIILHGFVQPLIPLWKVRTMCRFSITHLSLTIFLLCINNLSKSILRSLVSIYAEDTTVYRCIAKNLEDRKWAVHLSSDSDQVAQWEKNWFKKFNTDKTNEWHVSLPSTPKISPIMMGRSALKESPSVEHLLRLKLSPDLIWNSYIRSIATNAGKMVGSLCITSK